MARPAERIRPPNASTPIKFALPSLTEARALHALAKGEATDAQQKQALNFILLKASAAGSEVMVPGQADTTAYLAGRRSVSLQIGWVLNHPPDVFRGEREQD